MQTFGTKDLDSMMEGLRAKHYQYFSTSPVLFVIYQDLLRYLEQDEGCMIEEKENGIDMGFSGEIRMPTEVLTPDNQILKMGFTSFYDEDNDDAKDVGMVLTTEDVIEGSFLSEGVLRVVNRYDANTLWNEALSRGLCDETASQYEKKMTKLEKDRNLRYVQIFRVDPDVPCCGWTFDKEIYLWGRDEASSFKISTPDVTLMMYILDDMYKDSGGYEEIFAAESDKVILNRNFNRCGLYYTSGWDTGLSFVADRSRERKLYRAVDSFVESMPLKVLYDARNK